MSHDHLDDEDTQDYPLPEDGQQLLRMLGTHLGFLARLAQPGSTDPLHKWTSQARQQELASGLRALSMQVEQRLKKVVPWARAEEQTAASTDDDSRAYDTAVSEPLVLGMTMEQFDRLDHLLRLLAAQGDAVSANCAAGFAKGTVSLLGQSIFDGALVVREILDEIEQQRLPALDGMQRSVSEERAHYAVMASIDRDSAGARLFDRASLPITTPRLH
ncbi:XAC0095 family protein [Pseudoxanthomonas composti]|uniref:XAC0095-like domain-containing protein n=1 Tax=Pseudoxanthomonas composti TaxID=2137479 RepID=A0A4Q1JUC7_9GAMM|nr:hypothetical protein [Pseudoxanthomonas composti]RXR05311.1 hypothetical protein EPA99_11260 [Pseudoxanthomonas composti]